MSDSNSDSLNEDKLKMTLSADGSLVWSKHLLIKYATFDILWACKHYFYECWTWDEENESCQT